MLTAIAPAKLNLFLHVTGRRPDGYHLLESLVAFADSGDNLSVEASDWLTLEAFGPYAEGLPAHPEENHVMKVARRLQRHAGTRRGAKISLEKKLPVASGIGGGSSDAATAARLLCQLWSLSYTTEDLADLLLPLGADIPVCLFGRPALMRGVGEKVEAAPALPAWHVVLVNPQKPLATAEVFRQLASHPFSQMPAFSSKETLDAALLRERTCNHLEPAAITLMPEIQAILHALGRGRHCLLARLSGSGATCFGLFAWRAEAEQAAAELACAFPQYWVHTSSLLRYGQ